MKIIETSLPGVFEVRPTPNWDARGNFTRVYCPELFAKAGINFTSTQVNIATSYKRYTLRGMHFQDAPLAEAKYVRIVKGSAQDVVIDLRPDSPTYKKWISVILTAEDQNGVFIPEGCAHGYLTLNDSTDFLYQMGRPYVPGHGKGVRWNDPAFGIKWLAEPSIVSDPDQKWADFAD
jgi:dTDP-4-dehydrorhamnose 3,5-epimerase